MSDITKPQYFCTRCQVHWSGTHRCRDRIDAQRAIEVENASLRAQLAAAEARVGEVESALADANSVATALSTLHTMKLIREGRTDGRDDFGPEVRAACERLQAFNERAAALRERGRA